MSGRAAMRLVWLAALGPLALASGPVVWGALGQARPVPAPPTVAAGIPPPPPDLAPVWALAPFGVPPGPVAAPTGTRADPGLTLSGVLIADDPAASVAFVAPRGGRALAFGIGETLPGGATLVEVLRGGVVLDIDGMRETLGFPVAAAKADGAAAIRARLPGAAAGVALPREGTPPDQVIETYRRLIAANPAAVLDRLGLEATPEGYRIGATAHQGVRRAGLRPGDVVARVNGVAVGDPERDRRLFDAVAEEGRARVEVVRDGRSIILSFPVR